MWESFMTRYISLIICVISLFACKQSKLEFQDINVAAGKIERIKNFESEFVSPRNIDVWLPDKYSNKIRYAVLYMHDGQMLFDSTHTWNKQEWGVDETMSKLLANKEIRNTLVVGVWSTEFRHSEYFPQKPFESLPENFRDSILSFGTRHEGTALFKSNINSDNYLEFIVEELKPLIDEKYSTLQDLKNTFIAGSSMGGLISIYALCEYPDVFSGAACLSTHWPGSFDTIDNPVPRAFAQYLDENLPEAENHRIYFDFGTETLDSLYAPLQANVDSIMRQHDYHSDIWKTIKFEGENHSETAWNNRLHIPLKFLLSEDD